MTTYPVEEPQHITALRVAVQALDLFCRGVANARPRECERCEFSPEVVRYWLRNFEELTSAVEGVSAAGANAITGGKRERLTLLALHSDLESATDKALINGKYLMWQQTHRIYRRQKRESFLYARRRELTRWQEAGNHWSPTPEPTRPLAEAICIEAISRKLGWTPHECENG